MPKKLTKPTQPGKLTARGPTTRKKAVQTVASKKKPVVKKKY